MSEINFNERPHKNEKADSIDYVKELIQQARVEGRESDIQKLEKLLQIINTKKYGLIWEEHAEKVEKEMKTKIPVFIADTSKQINGNSSSSDYNFVLEGDNLHSLYLLEKTYLGKIDVIYIDPPYNTGNKDFKYNDSFVDKTDTFAHSKWLSFMERRLNVAKKLLAEDGVIFISIDENEYAHLKLLLDEIFGENNFIANFIWQSTPGSNTGNEVKTVTESIITYCKNRNKRKIGSRPIKDTSKYKLEDPYVERRGKYLLNKLDRRMTGSHYSEALNYSIKCPDGELLYPGNSLEKLEHWNWRWSSQKVQWGIENGFIEFKKGKKGWSIYFKQYQFVDNTDTHITRTLPFQNLILDEEGLSSARGTKEVMDIFGEKKFDYPKPVNLIKYILQVHPEKNSIILDFFAGSGTTGQAVTELNKEDGGTRKFILATNNENNIAEEVTYERMKRISEGTVKYEAHPLNLKYFKTDFVIKENFPDVSLEYELLKYVTPLVELEFAIDISNPKVQIILNEEQLESLIENEQLISNSTIFMHPDVFRDAEQNRILSDLQVKVQEIPNYFFGTELWMK